MREWKVLGVAAVDLAVWAVVVVVAAFAAANWDPFWGFFPVIGIVLLAWLALRWQLAARATGVQTNSEAVATGGTFRDPGAVRWLFASPAAAPIWLVVRVFLGWQWLQSGWGKVTGDGWVNQDGAALEGFWTRIVAVPEAGRPAIQYSWYRDFIDYMLNAGWANWFAVLIAYTEVVVGLALIIGLLTGLAALAGATLNFNFMLAGTASTNPVLFAAAVLLLLAWKVAGWIGLDRWALPLLGTPWQPGQLPSRGRDEVARDAQLPSLATH